MSWKSSKTNLILSVLSTPKSAEDILKIFPSINRQTIFSTLSIKAQQGILDKSDTIPRKYVLKSNEEQFELNSNSIPTVHDRISSLKNLPVEFTDIDFASYWWELGYDFGTIKNSFGHIVSVLKKKNKIQKLDRNHWRLKKKLISSKTHAVHKKVKNKILCGYKSYFPIEINASEKDDDITCKRCLRDMILKLTGDGGKFEKKKWMQTDVNQLQMKLEKIKRTRKKIEKNIEKKEE